MKNGILACGVMALAGILASTAYGESDAQDSRAYERCLAGIERSPEGGFEAALVWRDEGGGAAARHCVALALMALNQPEAAATRLEALALQAGAGGIKDRAALLGQAGQAWLMAGRPDEADLVLTSAIDLNPRVAAFFIDRSEAQRRKGNLNAALGDLSNAISMDRTDASAFLMRAVVRRALGDIETALQDAERALQLDPTSIEAILERGRLLELSAGRSVD